MSEETEQAEVEVNVDVPATQGQPAELATREEATPETQERKKNSAEYNWAEARRKMQDLERKNYELEEREKARDVATRTPEKEDDGMGLADTDLAEGKHLKSLNKELKQLRAQLREQQVSSIDLRLQAKYADFGSVVSAENIQTLKETEPELAESLRHQPDPYQQGVAAYRLIKSLGIQKASSPANPDKERARTNTQKPVSVNAVTKQSAIGNAHLFENGLTKELKASLWKEMQELSKRA